MADVSLYHDSHIICTGSLGYSKFPSRCFL